MIRKFIKILYCIIFILFIIVLQFFNKIIAQEETAPGVYKVNRIYAVGNNHYPEDLIKDISGLKSKEDGGEIEIPSEETHNAIERLWNFQIFSDIQILFRKITLNNIDIIIKVEELPQLDTIIFTGNREFSAEDLNEKLQLDHGRAITKQIISDIAYNIKKYYAYENYPFTEVKVDTSQVSSARSHDLNLLRIKVFINEGGKKSLK